MQTRRRCAQCNTLNDPEQVYCVNCGKYLRGKVVKQEERITIWGMGVKPNPVWGSSGVSSVPKKTLTGRYVVICPECLSKHSAEPGKLPLSCMACGYFFQAGIDKVVLEGTAGNQKPAVNPSIKPPVNPVKQSDEPVKNNTGSGPLKRAANDTSSLRLICVTSGNIMPEMMKEIGNTIGKDGTIFKMLRTDQQLNIWHTRAGWYVRANSGFPLYNGSVMNQSVSKKLSDGDFLVIENEQFRVEIF